MTQNENTSELDSAIADMEDTILDVIEESNQSEPERKRQGYRIANGLCQYLFEMQTQS